MCTAAMSGYTTTRVRLVEQLKIPVFSHSQMCVHGRRSHNAPENRCDARSPL